MNNIGIFKAWSTLSVQQRIIAIGSTLAVIGCFWALFTVSSKEGQALLFSGLEPAAAGEVIGELDSMAIPYSVKGSAIYVPASQKDRLRLDLAQKGLPATSGVGYEILDNLNGFSTTADMFNAAYWRAKEGELSRTILAMPGVRSARVHLGVTRESAFRRQTSNKTASVTLDAPMGLSEEKARSVQFLTALAVPNLSPDSVAVIDMQRGVLAGPGGAGKGMSDLDVDSRTAELETKLSRLLEAHVGMGNARVTVAMDVERQSFAQTERRVDPNSRQVVSRKVEEERDTEQTLGGGVVTVASNLPDGEAELTPPGEDENPILRTRRNEDILYTGTEVETITE
ncbi:MAG: flagellar basal-body MS-ring/collar protein FliF, partial [Pseudomonadota bacterium]